MPSGKFVLSDPFIEIGGTELADQASSLSFDIDQESKEVTAFGTAGAREYLTGLNDTSVTVDFYQNYDASKVDAILAPLIAPNTSTTITIRPSTDAIGIDNPEYTSTTAILESYSPVSGDVGEPSTTQATFKISGGFTRATS